MSRTTARIALCLPVGALLVGLAGCAGTVEASSEVGPSAGPAIAATASSAAAASPSPASSAAPETPGPAEPTVTEGEVLPGAGDGSGAGTEPTPSPPTGASALAVLDGLQVKGRAPRTGYDRELFGQAWLDVDGNGCDTRNDMLHRDLTGAVTADGCTVTSGTLADPYTATTIDFVRGPATSSAVQIDHVVALSDAWQKGAQRLDGGTRVLFANDPLNLLAVDGPTNQAKGDGDAATWLPPNEDFRCEYVAIQIAVKAKYKLWVTTAEKDAMARVLGECPGWTVPADPGRDPGTDTRAAPATAAPSAPLPENPVQELPRTTAPAASAPAPQPVAPSVSYANCSAVRAAGAAPIRVGEPGYGAHLDRDGDGTACE